jgi:hypothetical protein
MSTVLQNIPDHVSNQIASILADQSKVNTILICLLLFSYFLMIMYGMYTCDICGFKKRVKRTRLLEYFKKEFFSTDDGEEGGGEGDGEGDGEEEGEEEGGNDNDTSKKIVTINSKGDLSSALYPMPLHGIIAYYGSMDTIPAGWALCDGTLETPDLRGRFLIGANSTSYKNNTNILEASFSTTDKNQSTVRKLPAAFAMCYIMKL